MSAQPDKLDQILAILGRIEERLEHAKNLQSYGQSVRQSQEQTELYARYRRDREQEEADIIPP